MSGEVDPDAPHAEVDPATPDSAVFNPSGSGPTQRTRPVTQGTKIGNYVIDDVIGAGGMGIVYAAHDPKLDRRVAIKLLLPALSRDELQGQALLREAQAMARLSHPNVCTIYEVGQLDEQVFIAMEYVAGETLGQWLRRAPRTWREVVDVMVSAGRGLDAAHRAGIIHRDFKPDNVMIGRDGRVRVMDFGLAGLVTETSPGVRLPNRSDPVEQPQTLFGGLLGTPEFMSPEQLNMERADARSDQFAFCVTLYKALYNLRPFPGRTLGQLIELYDKPHVVQPPQSPRVPRWLRNITLRGLTLDPGARYPSVGALIDELIAIPRRRQRAQVIAAVTGLVVVGVGLSVLLYSETQSSNTLCQGARERIAPMWNDARRGAVRDALAQSGLPYADRQWELVKASLDRYTERWATLHQDACEATHVRGEQSGELLDRRMLCLDGRRQELDALVTLLSEPDRSVAQRATQAALSLGDLDRCMTRAALITATPDPKSEDERTRLASVRERLAQAKVLLDAGKYKQGLVVAQPLTAEARALGYDQVMAQVLYYAGRLHMSAGALDAGEDSLLEAALAAERAFDDVRKAEALIFLAGRIGWDKAQYAQAHRWLRLAGASLRRAGGDRKLEAKLLQYTGLVSLASGEIEKAHEFQIRALDLFEAEVGPDHPEVIETLSNLGNTFLQLGNAEQSLKHLQRALDAARRVLGEEHPEVAHAFVNLGNLYMTTEEYRAAERAYVRARELWETALGRDHMYVAIAVTNLGYLAYEEERYDDALRLYRRALAIEERGLSPEHPNLAVTLTYLGIVHVSNGNPNAAIRVLERALRVGGDADSAVAAQARFALGRALWATGKRVRAVELVQSARSLLADAGESAAADLAEVDRWLDDPE